MNIDKRRLSDNLDKVYSRMAAACGRARRDISEITLIAVTKSVPVEVVRELVLLGQTDLGESRVQQLSDRVGETGIVGAAVAIDRRLTWHMIGHLQRNKVRQCLQCAQVVQSVDSLRLAEELSARAVQENIEAPCMLEVNTSLEAQKHGVAVGAAVYLAEQIAGLDGLKLIGLMTMAPLVENPEDARQSFTRLRELFEEMRTEKIGGTDLRHLSMGMSNDFEVAIEEGATMVRIGSALFEGVCEAGAESPEH